MPSRGPWIREFERKPRRGWPVATLAFYGPDDRLATKVVAAVVVAEGEEPAAFERWFGSELDVRVDRRIGDQVAAFYRKHGAKTIVVKEGIFGCPHEEGTDYPEGEVCPICPFWADRDRHTGKPWPHA